MERLYYTLGEPVDEKKARHVMRYNFIAEQIKGKETKLILDFGCGSGYGTKLLSLALPNSKIIGYDISPEAIEFAEKNNSNKNVEFTSDLPKIKGLDFDYITMVDCIEHINKKDTEEILKTLAKNKKAKVFISTPLNEFIGQSPSNPFHINCYVKETFSKLLSEHFKFEYWLIDWYYYRLMNEAERFGPVMAICEAI